MKFPLHYRDALFILHRTSTPVAVHDLPLTKERVELAVTLWCDCVRDFLLKFKRCKTVTLLILYPWCCTSLLLFRLYKMNKLAVGWFLVSTRENGWFPLRKISMGSDRIGTKLNPRMGFCSSLNL